MAARPYLIACHLRAELIAAFRDYAVDGSTVSSSFGPVSVDVGALAERIDGALADGERPPALRKAVGWGATVGAGPSEPPRGGGW